MCIRDSWCAGTFLYTGGLGFLYDAGDEEGTQSDYVSVLFPDCDLYDAVFLHNLVQQSDNLVLPGGYGSSRVCRVQAMGHNKIKKRG